MKKDDSLYVIKEVSQELSQSILDIVLRSESNQRITRSMRNKRQKIPSSPSPSVTS